MLRLKLIFLLASLLLIPACGPAKPAAPAAKKLTIGVSVPGPTHHWTAGLALWAHTAMDQHPEINWVYAEADSADKQINDIEAMMAKQKLDGLVVLAIESGPLTKTAKQIKKNGIFLVNVDRGFTEPVADIFLEGDNKAFGRKAAEFIAQKLNGKGNIVILTGIPCTVDTDRVQAARAVFAKYPDIKILAQQPGLWNAEKSEQVMRSFLSQFNNIDAVWAADDDMALGAEKAIRDVGAQDKIWIFGGGGMKDIVKKIMDKDPMYPADITYPPAMIAAGIHLAVANLTDGNEKALADKIPAHLRLDTASLRDKKLPPDGKQRDIKLDVHLITPENAKDFYFPNSKY